MKSPELGGSRPQPNQEWSGGENAGAENQNNNPQSNNLTVEQTEKFQAAEEKILDGHRQRVGGRLARRVLRLFEQPEPEVPSSQPQAESENFDNQTQAEIPSAQPDSVETPNTPPRPTDPDLPSLSDFFNLEDLAPETPLTPDQDQSPESARPADQYESAMRTLIRQETVKSAREYFGLKKRLVEDQLMLKIAIDNAKKQAGRGLTVRSEVTDARRDKIEADSQRLAELPSHSPESHAVVHGYELRQHIKEIADGEMVTTPYVADHLAKVQKNMDEGRPTFIHGHLGSGKTELAIMAAKHSSVSRAAYRNALAEYSRFKQDNPTAPKSEHREMLGKFYRKHSAQLEKALRDGDSAAVDQFSPLVISGSKDLTSQDLYADKTLKLTKFNGKPLLEHKKDLDAEIEKWRNENPEDAKDPEKSKAEADKILELYKLKNQAFGTEVETIKQAIYRGVEEGRPVIIDEVNAIPAAVLISMNDILQRRPGQSCYIPGAGQVQIKDGFSITMTGNLSSGNIDYIGTDELNPATISRLDVMEHDYLPMSETDTNYHNQSDPKQNELFQVMVAGLAERTGDLRLPEMDKSLDKLFKLAQYAHATQLVFEGKWRESNMQVNSDSGDELEPSLKKSVLSIRNILNVLKDWDKGSEKDLDKALWDSFISNMINPNDQNFALALARQYGFFSESDGWQVRIKERGAGFTSLAEIHPGEFDFVRQPLETLDLRGVVDVLYGDRPERTVYPELDLDELEDTVDDELTIEDFAEIEGRIEEITKVISALEKLGEQYGCSVADAPGNNGNNLSLAESGNGNNLSPSGNFTSAGMEG